MHGIGIGALFLRDDGVLVWYAGSLVRRRHLRKCRVVWDGFLEKSYRVVLVCFEASVGSEEALAFFSQVQEDLSKLTGCVEHGLPQSMGRVHTESRLSDHGEIVVGMRGAYDDACHRIRGSLCLDMCRSASSLPLSGR